MGIIIRYILIGMLSLIGLKYTYAQQLIYNQSFENIFRNISYTYYSCAWYQYNQYNMNMYTHTYAFSYGVDSFSKSQSWLGIACAKGDTFNFPYDLAADGTRYLVINKERHIGLRSNGYYYNAWMSGIALETKATLKQNNYYLCSFFTYYSNTSSGLLIGVSDSQQYFGSTIGHAYPSFGIGYSPPVPEYYWRKFKILFQSPITANQVTFMGDFDTTVKTQFALDYVSLYPVKFCSTRTVSLCHGDSMKIKALLTGNNYEWNMPVGLSGSSDSGLYITIKDTGLYQCYIYTNDTVIVDSIHVIYNNYFNQTESEKIICKDDSMVLAPSVILYHAKFIWNIGDTSLQITINNAGIYWIKSNYLTCIFTDTFYVNLDANPLLILPVDTVLCEGATLILEAKNAVYNTYLWNTGETTSAISITQAGRYIVTANDGNCFTKDSTLLNFVNCNYHLYMPNAFTPNNDSLNDIFKGYGMGIAEFEMHIYNRLAIEVFSSNDINIGWDGTFKNQPCMGGTYVWMVTYRLKNETNLRTDRGAVTLMK